MKTQQTMLSHAQRLLLLIISGPDRSPFTALQAHYEILYAYNFDEGLLQARLYKPQLIIFTSGEGENDFRLQLMKHYRTRLIPVLAIVPHDALDLQRLTFSGRRDDFIRSPFPEQELLLRVHTVLANRSYLNEKYINYGAAMSLVAPQEEFLQRVKLIVEENLDNHLFGVADLARKVGVSQPQLYRKLIAMTGFSANGYIRHIRLKQAAHLLSSGAGNVGEVAFRVGFSSQSYFSKCFKAMHHKNPKRWSA